MHHNVNAVKIIHFPITIAK